MKGATEHAAAGEKDDETLATAVEGGKKKLESATKQVETAEKNLTEPAMPNYQGLSGSYGSSSGRRLSLARWLADPDNPLTARVAVNHIWLRHFGRPLVPTVFDFGLSGAEPTHPELLDWLAAELQQPSLVFSEKDGWVNGEAKVEPWSMKHLHRLIVTSRAYRSSSTPEKGNITNDPDNHWLWRMPPRRMDAETVRDSALFVAGGLDITLGGPDLPCSDGMSLPRRSLYFHRSPERQMNFLKLFDAADTTECYQRHVSIVPHQALALFNSELSLIQSRRLTRKLSKNFADDISFIKASFEHVLSRPVGEKEAEICSDFLAAREKAYQADDKASANDQDSKDGNHPSTDPRQHARENLVHSLFNHHDFVTIK